MLEKETNRYNCREYLQYKTLISINLNILKKGRKKQGEIAIELTRMWYQKAVELDSVDIQDNFLSEFLKMSSKSSKTDTYTLGKLCRKYFDVIKNKVKKDEIINIYFKNTQMDDFKRVKYDVSSQKDGSVELWLEKKDEGYDLYIGGNGGVEAPENCENLFYEYKNVKKIVFQKNFKTNNVNNMSGMFNGCEQLRELDVEHFVTENVKNMSYMFTACGRLEKIDISNFRTSNVENMSCMFSGCAQLKKLDISNFETGNVKDMSCMFLGCNQLKELDISNFDMCNAKNIYDMFIGCEQLKIKTSKIQNETEYSVGSESPNPL